MDNELTKLRGFREFYPDEMEARKIVFDKMREISTKFNFREIDAPSLENFEIFRRKSGDEIINQTFSFYDKGGRHITLIPEITPIVARMVSQVKNMPMPQKWFSIPKLWRYEEPQSGRLREFYQYNADIFGSKSVYADAEIILLSKSILNNLGLKDKYIIKISDRYLAENILKKEGFENIEEIFKIIDKMEKIGKEKTKEILLNVVGEDKANRIIEIFSLSGEFDHIVNKIEYNERLDYLGTLNDILKDIDYGKFIFDLSIVRGLAYYTGLVFEGHDYKNEFRAILGGGRYDRLTEMFNANIPAVGFGMGDAVLELLMKREKVWPEYKRYLDFFVVIVGDFQKYGMKIIKELREMGYSVDYDPDFRSIQKQMRMAQRENARYAIILGEEEYKNNNIKIKDMETGNQETVPFENLTLILRKYNLPKRH
ncbi:MAG: histidine--tRNA ligase [Thermoplasmata archaeon]